MTNDSNRRLFRQPPRPETATTSRTGEPCLDRLVSRDGAAILPRPYSAASIISTDFTISSPVRYTVYPSAMASSLRLPAGSLLSVARPGFHPANSAPASIAAKSCQCRSFSQTPITQRGMPGMPQNVSIRQPPQPSMKTKGREMSKADLPQDLGLLPGTFVRPLWRDLPSIFQLPRERLQMEWLWLKSWAQNFIGCVCN